MVTHNNKIVIPQFYRGRDIYEDELGWQENEK